MAAAIAAGFVLTAYCLGPCLGRLTVLLMAAPYPCRGGSECPRGGAAACACAVAGKDAVSIWRVGLAVSNSTQGGVWLVAVGLVRRWYCPHTGVLCAALHFVPWAADLTDCVQPTSKRCAACTPGPGGTVVAERAAREPAPLLGRQPCSYCSRIWWPSIEHACTQRMTYQRGLFVHTFVHCTLYTTPLSNYSGR